MRRLLVSSILVTGLAITGAAGTVYAEQPGDSPHAIHEMEQTHREINSGNIAGEGQEYTVKPGDTLATIAEEHLGSADKWEVIARANGIERPDQLEAGRTIVIPSTPDTQGAASSGKDYQNEAASAGESEADNALSEKDREMKGEITEINTENETLMLTDESGNIHSFKLENEELVAGIEVGDLVQVVIKGDGRVISVEKIDKQA